MKSGPLAAVAPNKQQTSDSLRPDHYKLSSVVETRTSHDNGLRPIEFPKSSNWFNHGRPQPPSKDSKKSSKRSTSDDDSEKSLNMHNSKGSSDEDATGIMVSKSFYITDEERIASRDSLPYR